MEQWTKEDVYDEQIAPLMAQIIAICKEHRIPLVAQFNYAADDEGPSFCTTIIPASAVDRDDDGQSQRMARVAKPPPSFMALTVTSGPKKGGG